MPGPIACVIGELDLVRALALAGVPCAAVAPRGSPVRASRHVREAIDWADPAVEPEVLVERLLAWARGRDRPVLFYDGDWDLLLVSRHRDRLAGAFRFVVAEPELVEDLVDKARFQALAERLELPVPRGSQLAPGDPTPDLDFPLVVKPLTRLHATWRPHVRAKAAVAAGPAELEELRGRIGAPVLAQELVAGPESRIESYHCYVDGDGHVAGEFAGRKLRTYPREHGYTTALVTTDAADVLELGRDLVARMGLTGVAKLDFKRDAAGALRLLEVNPRFNLWHHPGALAGVNLPALVYADLCGLPRPPAARARAGVRWVSPRDVQAARAHGLPLRRWLRFALAAEAKSPASWDDPLPLVRTLARRSR
jgi:predicted ATP-grasp superfamily ATP-dependent carboligase